MNSLAEYFSHAAELYRALDFEKLARVTAALERARAENRRVFVFGNGGSAATASHFACDLGKGTIQPHLPRVKVICLNDNLPTLTAYANDVGFDAIFSEPLISLSERGDLALAFSASGNSPNIIRALQAARARGLLTIGFSGFTGGKLAELADIHVHVPSHSYGHVEDVHLAMCHAICETLKIAHK
ncbi:MAG: SIS domain-containing protein [Chloroflexi bacterium]|nr:SIS domain-containing protein [Chloroflexota bacterium]